MAELHPSISDNQEETQVANNHSKTQNNPNEQSAFSNPSQTNDHVPLGLRDTVRLTGARSGVRSRTCTTNNNHTSCDSNPLKINFCHMTNSKKLTGQGVCPLVWIREAKKVDKAIQNRAAHNVLIDNEGDEDGNTNDKRSVFFY
ncbi:hypothetical protein VP01_2429g1 [Puccinia sorghi]|uniref:Uncharacterized protein n=1 Tax=Puccinia sorghi TaxID=27349 RepID=A0A0L6V6M1_9BASI|nr:hypothetical protein VP01_2429g1 [Puccinia sorghi]